MEAAVKPMLAPAVTHMSLSPEGRLVIFTDKDGGKLRPRTFAFDPHIAAGKLTGGRLRESNDGNTVGEDGMIQYQMAGLRGLATFGKSPTTGNKKPTAHHGGLRWDITLSTSTVPFPLNRNRCKSCGYHNTACICPKKAASPKSEETPSYRDRMIRVLKEIMILETTSNNKLEKIDGVWGWSTFDRITL